MRSRTLPSFRKKYRELSPDVRRAARASYRLISENPRHRSLNFKRVRTRGTMYSARVSDDYRAVAYREGDTWVWFWIGPHSEYDQLLKRL